MGDLASAVTVLLDRDVVRMTALGGGDVADAFRVTLADGGTVFAKTHPTAPPGFFTTEAAGLDWLGEARAVPVPGVLAVSDDPPVVRHNLGFYEFLYTLLVMLPCDSITPFGWPVVPDV